MIERAEYTAIAEQAIERFQTLSDIMPYNTGIVYVISREVYEAMREYEHEFLNDRVNVRPDGIVDICYCGTCLAIINEDIADNFFMPVIYNRDFNFQHFYGLQVGDFVIFNDGDGNRIFRIESLTPTPVYKDTGLTVGSFFTWSDDFCNAAAYLADNTATLGNAITELTWAYSETVGVAMAEAADRLASYAASGVEGTAALNNLFGTAASTSDITLDSTQINMDLPQELTGESGTPRRVKKCVSKDKELSPGNTKLLDEYLNSFLKGGC